MNRILKVMAAAILMACLIALPVFAGGGGQQGGGVSSAAPGPLGKYTPEISLTSARGMDSTLVTDGDKWKDYEDNQWFRNYKEVLGINLSYKWVSPDGDSDTAKWGTAIASGDVPDFAKVNDNIYKLLYDAGLIADMTKLWEEYASPELKEKITPSDYAQMTLDGKLMGFPQPGFGNGEHNILFIRKDWLDKAGLPVPETFEDVIAAARDFNRIKPGGPNTIPIALNNNGSAPNGVWTGFFNAHGAYWDMWLKQDGKLVYSNVQKEVRDALLSMQSCFREGLINKDFMAATDQLVGEYVANGQVGILWGPVWLTATSYHALNSNDPSNRMVYLYPPSVKGKSYLAQTHISGTPRIFVSSKSKYPEAAIKLTNLVEKYEKENHQYVLDNEVRPNKFNPWDTLLSYSDPVVNTANAIREAEETGEINPEYIKKRGRGIFSTWELYKNAKNGDPKLRWYLETFGPNSSYMIAYDALQNNRLINSAYLGLPTDTMTLKQRTINNELLAAMTEVIAGADISVYDRAVQKWYSDGGTQITNEVNDWYKKSGGK